MSSVSTQECRSGWRGFSDGMLGEGEARSCRLSRATFVHTCPQAPQEDPEAAFCEKSCKARRDAHRPGGRQSPGSRPATP
ncbi:hypothetical protein LEMLEM_LOCUS20154 [Lemmus lemmus]